MGNCGGLISGFHCFGNVGNLNFLKLTEADSGNMQAIVKILLREYEMINWVMLEGTG